MIIKILKRLKCKVFICFKSKCSLNDTDNNGVVDELTIENFKCNNKEEHDKSEISYAKKYKVVVSV